MTACFLERYKSRKPESDQTTVGSLPSTVDTPCNTCINQVFQRGNPPAWCWIQPAGQSPPVWGIIITHISHMTCHFVPDPMSPTSPPKPHPHHPKCLHFVVSSGQTGTSNPPVKVRWRKWQLCVFMAVPQLRTTPGLGLPAVLSHTGSTHMSLRLKAPSQHLQWASQCEGWTPVWSMMMIDSENSQADTKGLVCLEFCLKSCWVMNCLFPGRLESVFLDETRFLFQHGRLGSTSNMPDWKDSEHFSTQLAEVETLHWFTGSLHRRCEFSGWKSSYYFTRIKAFGGVC